MLLWLLCLHVCCVSHVHCLPRCFPLSLLEVCTFAAHPSFKTPSNATAHRMLATHSSRLEVIPLLDPEEQFVSVLAAFSWDSRHRAVCSSFSAAETEGTSTLGPSQQLTQCLSIRFFHMTPVERQSKNPKDWVASVSAGLTPWPTVSSADVPTSNDRTICSSLFRKPWFCVQCMLLPTL